MALFKKLFGKKGQIDTPATSSAQAVLNRENARFAQLSEQKEHSSPLTDQVLLRTFVQYFAPNKQFYSVPGSDQYHAYFQAINAAKVEMLNQPELYARATGRTQAQLLEMINHPEPGITNMLICGLIFHMGAYATIQDRLICVDFSEKIPNCIALYLLLLAQQKPQEQRRQLIDAGDREDKNPLIRSVNALKVLDPSWDCRIL